MRPIVACPSARARGSAWALSLRTSASPAWASFSTFRALSSSAISSRKLAASGTRSIFLPHLGQMTSSSALLATSFM